MLDVENLRPHYALTIEHWSRRFDAAADQVAAMFDDTFVRAWRLYLAGSQAAFTAGTMQLFQVVFARGASDAIPRARAATGGELRMDDMRRVDRRRWAGGLDLRVEAPSGGSRRAWSSTLRRFRATRSAPDGLHRRSSPNCASTPTSIGRDGHSSQSPDFASGSSGVAPGDRDGIRPPGQLRNPPLRVRSLSADAIEVTVCSWARRSRPSERVAGAGSSTRRSARRC